MKKNYVSTLLAIMLCFIGLESIKAQVGIQNNNPRGLLDVNDDQTGDSTSGLVVPVMTNTTSAVDPSTNAISTVTGTIVYDRTKYCLRVIKNDSSWSDCIGFDTNTNPIPVVQSGLNPKNGTKLPLRLINH